MYPSVQGPKKIVTMSASGEPIISEIPGSASDITVHDNQDPPSIPDESMPTPTEAGDDPLIPDPPVPMEGIPEVPTVPIDEEGAQPAPQAEAAPAMEQNVVIGDAPDVLVAPENAPDAPNVPQNESYAAAEEEQPPIPESGVDRSLPTVEA
jgi:hypothetical protein